MQSLYLKKSMIRNYVIYLLYESNRSINLKYT